MYSRDTACRVRFTVSGCVGCGGWFIADTKPLHRKRSPFSSRNGHPFVCVADISPNRGITFQERHYVPTNHFQISSVYNRSEATLNLTLNS